MDNHRRLETFRAAAVWDFDRWAYDEWERLNNLYFGSQLEAGQIVWGLTPYGACIGLHSGWRNVITLHQSLIEPDENWRGGITGRERIAADVLLHEMIHQSIYQRLGHSGCGHDVKKGDSCTSHNNNEWASEVNRIALMLGLPANAKMVRQRRVRSADQKGSGKVIWFVEDGMMDRGSLSRWPHSARPEGYYRNVPFEITTRLG